LLSQIAISDSYLRYILDICYLEIATQIAILDICYLEIAAQIAILDICYLEIAAQIARIAIR